MQLFLLYLTVTVVFFLTAAVTILINTYFTTFKLILQKVMYCKLML